MKVSQFNLLTELFNESIDGKSKVNILRERYNIPTTVEFEKEVASMTAYTANLEKRCIAMGEQRGEQIGEQIGKKKFRTVLSWLLKQGRLKDVELLADDEMALEKFYSELTNDIRK